MLPPLLSLTLMISGFQYIFHPAVCLYRKGSFLVILTYQLLLMFTAQYNVWNWPELV